MRRAPITSRSPHPVTTSLVARLGTSYVHTSHIVCKFPRSWPRSRRGRPRYPCARRPRSRRRPELGAVVDASSIFAFALIGGLVGFILGDFQREVRIRRQISANLKLANDRTPGPDADTNPGPDSHGHADSGPAWALGSVRDGQARRRAVSRPDVGTRPAAGLRGRGVRGTASTSLAADYDCG